MKKKVHSLLAILAIYIGKVNALKQQLRKKRSARATTDQISGREVQTLVKVMNNTHAQAVEQITPIVLVVFVMLSVIAVGK